MIHARSPFNFASNQITLESEKQNTPPKKIYSPTETKNLNIIHQDERKIIYKDKIGKLRTIVNSQENKNPST